ncbi:hypothetical protein ACX122_01480 [Kosakonia cowanii]
MSCAIINCEENGCLILDLFILEDGFFESNVIVRSDWYEARASFHVSKERLDELLLNLEKISHGSNSEAIFINEDGNFEVNFFIDHLGKARIAGVLIKSMMDSSALNYELYSDLQSIIGFYGQLKRILSD